MEVLPHGGRVATAFHEPMSRAGVNLDRLNDAELIVLRLLAEGHTAKSIANVTGSTPAAVNERLREARRKTGVGSSRELARLLKAQENRHKQIGLADKRVVGPTLSKEDAEGQRSHKGVFVMIILLMAVAAGTVALMSQADPATNEVDPLIGTSLQTPPDPAALHAKVRAESRDPNWAPSIEVAIRSRLLEIPLIGKDSNLLRITCATSLCEIAGTIIRPAPLPKEHDPRLPQNRAQRALQDKPLHDDLAKLGLKNETNMFTGSNAKPDRSVFLLYYSRVDAKQE